MPTIAKHHKIENIDAFIFDFDGVITNNFVYLDENGIETVRCSRADGLAFELLRSLDKPTYFLSSETNLVVSARAKKLKVETIQGVKDKLDEVYKLSKKNNYKISNICYVGNDLNDYAVMEKCGITACPSDSHREIKNLAKIELQSKGGEGVIRELLEKVFCLDLRKVLYGEHD